MLVTVLGGMASSVATASAYTFNYAPANLPNLGAQVIGVNNNGDLAGTFSPDGAANYYGFVNNTSFTGPKPNAKIAYNTSVNGINNNLQIAGEMVQGNALVGFYSSSTTYAAATTKVIVDTKLDGGTHAGSTTVNGLNDNGLVVGYHNPFGAALEYYSFIYNSANNTYKEILPAGITSGKVQAFGINDSGTVVGQYAVNSSSPSQGFIYTATGDWSTFSDPNANSLGTFPTAINNNGDITGYYFDAVTGNSYGFVYSASTNSFTNVSLQSPLSATAAIVPFGINDNGVIVGQITYQNDTNFEATPFFALPVPSSVYLMTTGLLALSARRLTKTLVS